VYSEAPKPERTATMSELIFAGANLNAVQENGKTALHFAVESDNVAGMTLLLICRADARIKDENGETANDLARKRYVNSGGKNLTLWRKIFLSRKGKKGGSVRIKALDVAEPKVGLMIRPRTNRWIEALDLAGREKRISLDYTTLLSDVFD